jgi:hypothetical protein
MSEKSLSGFRTSEFYRVTRSNVSIMLAGLYADLFRKDPKPSTLTRWCDLAEEIREI